MMTEPERRYIAGNELRAADGAQGPRLTGYAALHDVLSQDLGGFREIIRPGAFKRTLGADVRALFNHDPNLVLGRVGNGTLQLQEDARGLLIDVALPETTYARDLWRLVQRGDVSQMSFAFRVAAGGEQWDRRGDTVIRTITDLDLIDVSPVTYPAYIQTIVTARAAADAIRALEGPRNDPAALSLEAQARRRLLVMLQES